MLYEPVKLLDASKAVSKMTHMKILYRHISVQGSKLLNSNGRNTKEKCDRIRTEAGHDKENNDTGNDE